MLSGNPGHQGPGSGRPKPIPSPASLIATQSARRLASRGMDRRALLMTGGRQSGPLAHWLAHHSACCRPRACRASPGSSLVLSAPRSAKGAQELPKGADSDIFVMDVMCVAFHRWFGFLKKREFISEYLIS